MLYAALGFAPEVERDGAALIVDIVGGHVHAVPEIEILECFGAFLAENLHGLGESLGLTYDDVLEVLDAEVCKVCVPVEGWILLFELGVGELVIVALGVAELCHAAACCGHACLDAHDVSEHTLCVAFAKAAMACEADYVLLVGLAYGCGGGVGIEIVFFLFECETSLIDVEYVVFGVFLVGSDIEVKESCDALLLHSWPRLVYPLLGYLLAVLIAVDLEEELHLVHAVAVEQGAVHGTLVERGNLVFDAAGGDAAERGYAVDDAAQLFVGVLGKEVETAVAAIFGCEWVGFLPPSCGVLIEVCTGHYGSVHICLVYARGKGLLITPCA